MYKQVRWLSKGKVMQRYLSLLKEIRVVFIEKASQSF
jgi:hypothetical protein